MLLGAWWVWPVAVLVYVLFRLWYDNWRGPLTAQEIDAFMAQIAASSTGSTTEASVVRAFLEADDGKEFVMGNLVGLHTQPVTHPETGAQTSALEVMQEYGRRFVPMLFRHGGHPLLAMRKVGGYVDSWHTPPDPGWHIVGAMRYRSRRDMMRLSQDASLKLAHPFKAVATAVTFSFPAQVFVGFVLRPRSSVALILALLAALAHLGSLIALLGR